MAASDFNGLSRKVRDFDRLRRVIAVLGGC